MDYIDLYNRLVINPSIAQQVFQIATEIRKEKRYFEVERDSGVAAGLVGAIHQLESGRNFSTHLHNGDPLSRKTRRSPAGRPPGTPPFSWLESAVDAVDYDNLTLSSNKAEQCKSAISYNGLGYEKHGVVSPYGFTGSQFYKKGKYVSDGRYSSRTVSTQIGVCVILKEIERLDRLDPPIKILSTTTNGTMVTTSRLGDDLDPPNLGSSREAYPIKVEAPPKTNSSYTSVTRFIQPKPSIKISKYLTVGQFTKNGARKFVSQNHFQACKNLAAALDRVQAFYGRKLILTSGIRTPAQNRSAGGTSQSYHLTTNQRCAADVVVSGVSNYRVFKDFNSSWQGGLGEYSNGTTHFDLGYRRRWSWANRAGIPVADLDNIAYGEHDHNEEEDYAAKIFPVYQNSQNTVVNKEVILQTKRGTIIVKPNVNMYIGDVIIAKEIHS